MNVFPWIAAVLVAFAMLGAGAFKHSQPKTKLAASGQGWVEDFSASSVKAIGAIEVLAALGLILPAVLDIVPALVPIAAVGVVLLMTGAAITHARRGEQVADWVIEHAEQRTGATYELIGLADIGLPLLDELVPASMGHYAGAHTRA